MGNDYGRSHYIPPSLAFLKQKISYWWMKSRNGISLLRKKRKDFCHYLKMWGRNSKREKIENNQKNVVQWDLEMCIERNEFKEHEIETLLLYNEYCFTPSIHTVMSSIMPTK